MADEIRVTQKDDVPRDARVSGPAPPARPAPPPPPGPPPPALPPEEIDDPEVARAEIQATRARMSETINEIEDVLVRKKEKIQDRLDIFSPIRENPLPSAGIAFGAGLLLGVLTGGGGEEEDSGYWTSRRYRYDEGVEETTEDEWYPTRATAATAATAAGTGYAAATEAYTDVERDAEYWRRRAEAWEGRAHRLRDIAREQEEDLRSRQGGWDAARADSLYTEEPDSWSAEDWVGEDTAREIRSTLDDLQDRVVGGITDFITRAVNDLIGPGRGTTTRNV